NSWPRTEIIAARRLHRLKLFARERRRADDRHVATENIQKLRQALEHMKPALTARLRLREIVVCDPAFRLVLGHRRRNAQRITPERAAAIADALLRQKNLRTIAQLRDASGDKRERYPERRRDQREDEINSALGGPAKHRVIRDNRRTREVATQPCFERCAFLIRV